MKSRIYACWMPLCLLLAVAIAAAAPSWAQTGVSIISPRQGSSIAGPLPRPSGSAASSSALSGVSLILQREAGGAWLSWNGGCSSKTISLSASFNASTRAWQWPQSVALRSGSALAGGTYRLWALARSANGSVLGRAASTCAAALLHEWEQGRVSALAPILSFLF